MISFPGGQPPLFDADDLLLYAASPFAFWMERKCLVAGTAGPEPDPGSQPPESALVSQAELAERLPGQVALIDWRNPEPQRRQATLQALRSGSDWIVDGQLTEGSLSTTCNLLKRVRAGDSEEDPESIRYLPCISQPMPLRDARVHLCLAAELLSRILGRLPDQLLLMRDNELLASLDSSDWMPLFRAFLQRFLDDQAAFDASRPPDPSMSLVYGRWRAEAVRCLAQMPEAPEPECPVSTLVQPKGHPLDTPGFNILGARPRRPAREDSLLTPLSPVLDTRRSFDDE